MRESVIEAYVKANLPGRMPKWVSPGESGVPDRIALLPGGRVIFIEFKKPGGKLSPRQKLWIDRLKDLGQDVRVIGSMDEAKLFLKEVMANEV